MYYNLLGHSQVDEHLYCFYFLAIKTMLLETFVYMMFCKHVSISPGYLPQNVIAGLKCKGIFKFIRQWHTVFQSGNSILHSHSFYYVFTHLIKKKKFTPQALETSSQCGAALSMPTKK